MPFRHEKNKEIWGRINWHSLLGYVNKQILVVLIFLKRQPYSKSDASQR